MIILPIVQSVGEAMPGHPHPKLLVMATAVMCSGGRGGDAGGGMEGRGRVQEGAYGGAGGQKEGARGHMGRVRGGQGAGRGGTG